MGNRQAMQCFSTDEGEAIGKQRHECREAFEGNVDSYAPSVNRAKREAGTPPVVFDLRDLGPLNRNLSS
jgi:hypothetical protein